jgi:hypothetical protein
MIATNTWEFCTVYVVITALLSPKLRLHISMTAYDCILYANSWIGMIPSINISIRKVLAHTTRMECKFGTLNYTHKLK